MIKRWIRYFKSSDLPLQVIQVIKQCLSNSNNETLFKNHLKIYHRFTLNIYQLLSIICLQNTLVIWCIKYLYNLFTLLIVIILHIIIDILYTNYTNAKAGDSCINNLCNNIYYCNIIAPYNSTLSSCLSSCVGFKITLHTLQLGL